MFHNSKLTIKHIHKIYKTKQNVFFHMQMFTYCFALIIMFMGDSYMTSIDCCEMTLNANWRDAAILYTTVAFRPVFLIIFFALYIQLIQKMWF